MTVKVMLIIIIIIIIILSLLKNYYRISKMHQSNKLHENGNGKKLEYSGSFV